MGFKQDVQLALAEKLAGKLSDFELQALNEWVGAKILESYRNGLSAGKKADNRSVKKS